MPPPAPWRTGRRRRRYPRRLRRSARGSSAPSIRVERAVTERGGAWCPRSRTAKPQMPPSISARTKLDGHGVVAGHDRAGRRVEQEGHLDGVFEIVGVIPGPERGRRETEGPVEADGGRVRAA